MALNPIIPSSRSPLVSQETNLATREWYLYLAALADLGNGIVSVRDYGAVGDGVKDDRAALLAAMAAVAASGKALYFPAGTYLVGSPITLDSTYSGLKLIGTGANTSIIKKGFSGLDIPSRRMVFEIMSFSINDNKVGDSVIKSIPINVMDFLINSKLSPDMLFNDKPMLKDSLAVNLESSIPVMVNAALTKLINSHALITTEQLPRNAFVDSMRGGFCTVG